MQRHKQILSKWKQNITKIDESAAVDYVSCIYGICSFFYSLSYSYAWHDGSVAAVGHYFKGTVPHFPPYSPYDNDYRTSITAVQILVQVHSVRNILYHDQ